MLIRPLFVVATSGLSAVVGVIGQAGAAVADHSLSPNELELVGILAAGVAAVATIIAWIDRRIDRKLRDHNELDKERHRALVAEIRGTRDVFEAMLSGRARRPAILPVYEDDDPSDPQG